MRYSDPGLNLFTVTRRTVQAILHQDEKINQNIGFLHIPKTGGTSLVDFLTEIEHDIALRPVLLFHSWTVDLIYEYLPDIKLCFILRDPLERVVSGFQSRLRGGKPRYQQPWRDYEATCFAMFPSTRSFLNALLRSDEYSLNATEYALSHLLATSWNYAHYFRSASFVELIKNRILLIGKTDEMHDFVHDFCKYAIKLRGPENNLESIMARYRITNQSDQASCRLIGEYSDNEVMEMKSRLANEYSIYNELLAIKRSMDQSASLGTI